MANTKRMLAARIDADLLKALKHLSVDKERPMARLGEEALEKLLTEYRSKKPKEDIVPEWKHKQRYLDLSCWNFRNYGGLMDRALRRRLQ